ncbi:MAG TPA: N-acetyltransferase [Solimonas sp.]
MSDDLQIRDERPGDAPMIHALVTLAFRDAAHTSHTEPFIVDALRRADQLSISQVGEIEGVIVGHVAVSPVWISDGASGWYGLGPISVTPLRQGQGIGSRLMHTALEALRQRGAAGCVLLGAPAYYGRFGFRADERLVLPDVPPAYFQALSLDGTMPRGTVRYHPAFEATA